MEEFDVAIIGGGSSGTAAALRAADLGARVCLIEHSRIGGSGVLKGLLPLRTVLRLFDQGAVSKEKSGLKKETVDESFIRQWAREVEETAEAGSQEWNRKLAASGVQILNGVGRLVNANQILVQSREEENLVSARKIIIATGSSPGALPTIPFDNLKIIPGERIFELPRPWDDVLILGRGKAAVEVAVLLKRFSEKVFICDDHPRMFTDLDRDIQDLLEERLKQKKIKLLLGKRVNSVYKGKDKLDITLEGGVKFSVHRIIQLGKRKANSQNLDAGKLGIRLGEFGEILVDETQAASVNGIYAVGSVTGRPSSECLSEEEARVAAGNAMGKKRVLNPDWIPRIIFCDSVIASAGCFMEEAHHKGFRGVEGQYKQSSHEKGLTRGSRNELYKIVAEKASGKIIGGQIVSDYGAEVLPIVLLAIKKGLTLESLGALSFGQSNGFYGLREAARACVKALKNDGGGPVN